MDPAEEVERRDKNKAKKEKRKKKKQAMAAFKKEHQAFFDEVMQILGSDDKKNEQRLRAAFEKEFDGKTKQEKYDLIEWITNEPRWYEHFPKVIDIQGTWEWVKDDLSRLNRPFQRKTLNNIHNWENWHKQIADYLGKYPDTNTVIVPAREPGAEPIVMTRIEIEWAQLRNKIDFEKATVVRGYYERRVGHEAFPPTLEQAFRETKSGLQKITSGDLSNELIDKLTSDFLERMDPNLFVMDPQEASQTQSTSQSTKTSTEPFTDKTIKGVTFTEESIQSLQPGNDVHDEVASFIFDKFNGSGSLRPTRISYFFV
jgi:hypothetical protein